MISSSGRGHLRHETARVAAAAFVAFLSVAGTLLVLNTIGIPPWLSVPSALTLAVVVGFLLGAQPDQR